MSIWDTVPMWALTLAEIDVPMRVRGLALDQGLTKAWHLAAVCDVCLIRGRNIGTKSVSTTRARLAEHGFPAVHRYCGRRGWHRQQSACLEALQVCRDMLEPAQRGPTHA
jgi:hypothetical protein